MISSSGVKEAINAVAAKVAQAAGKTQVTLIAVSKTKPVALLMEAYEAGHRDFGENYVEEMVEKAESMPADIRWHFIGHLQSNKISKVLSVKIASLQTVDTIK